MGNWLGPTAYLLGIGWYFATCIILGIGIGLWADARTGLEPVLTLTGILLGLAIALIGGYRMLQPLLSRFGNEPPE